MQRFTPSVSSGNTPARTRTFNPLMKSQPENGSDDIHKGDSAARVCGSVGGDRAAPDALLRLVDIARLAEELTAAEREALVAMLGVVNHKAEQ